MLVAKGTHSPLRHVIHEIICNSLAVLNPWFGFQAGERPIVLADQTGVLLLSNRVFSFVDFTATRNYNCMDCLHSDHCSSVRVI